jgi:hypothetical protein
MARPLSSAAVLNRLGPRLDALINACDDDDTADVFAACTDLAPHEARALLAAACLQLAAR